MEYRAIQLDYVERKIKGVWLKASLDKTYKTLFKNACKGAKRRPNDVEHGIRVIIFGCFWIESYANELLQTILMFEIKSPKLFKEIWNKLKRDFIDEKLNLFSKIVPNQSGTTITDTVTNRFNYYFGIFSGAEYSISDNFTVSGEFGFLCSYGRYPQINGLFIYNRISTVSGIVFRWYVL